MASLETRPAFHLSLGANILWLVVAYAITISASAWVYKNQAKNAGWDGQDALLFSIDTVAARGRIQEPQNATAILTWWAAFQTLGGHLALPLAISALFASASAPKQGATSGDLQDERQRSD